MRLSRVRAELRSQRYGVAMGAVALLVAVGAPAQALEGATSATSSVAKALKIAKKADKRSKKALNLAKKVSRKRGPQGKAGLQGATGLRGGTGPQGPSGPPTGPAGGDLVGSYPNPDIAPDAVGTNEVASNALSTSDIGESTLFNDNSLTGGDIDESSLILANDSVRSRHFGAIIRRTSSVSVPGGGTAENGNYDTTFDEVSCFDDELALAGSASWGGAFVAGDELWLSEFRWVNDATTLQPNLLHVVGGNDTGTARTLNIAVDCLEP